MTAISNRLDRITRETGYLVGYKPTRRVRGWPEMSRKPFQLYQRFTHPASGKESWVYVASFATVEKLEINWRGRAGC